MIWKVIEEFPNYEISEYGDVRRVKARRGQTVTAHIIGKGYVKVGLYKDGRSYNRYVHRLVARAFIGEPPTPDHEVAHNDGIKSSNYWMNLRYATPKENSADRVAHGTLVRGERHLSAKLTEVDVLAIRTSPASCTALALHYQMSIAAISAARRGDTWNHVGDAR